MRVLISNGDSFFAISKIGFVTSLFTSTVLADAMEGIRLNFFNCASGNGPWLTTSSSTTLWPGFSQAF
ncbi:Uncharacterised protein [Enterobacter cloacae]|nr:Uncharacterised protein [Enterobacter cloacae]